MSDFLLGSKDHYLSRKEERFTDIIRSRITRIFNKNNLSRTGSESSDSFFSSVKKNTLRSSFFELSGYATQQILRFTSNIILSRLLFPAAFGLSLTVSLLVFGLSMLSDMGLEQFIIQSPKGEDKKYLNTAFTLQVIRGIFLAFIMNLLAHPAAWFFKEPQLVALIHLGSIQLIATGLNATSINTMRRRLTLGWVTILDLGQSILTMAIMIPWAIISPSVYPLVVGGSISACIHSVATHFIPVGYKNKFYWDREILNEINHFGKWIFGSTLIAFLGTQVDRVFYGKFLGMTWLGVYTIALNLSEAVTALLQRFIGGIVYPVLSKASREVPDDMSRVYYRVRLRLDLMAMGGTGFLAGFGGWFILSFWDDRYADASWILRILCLRVAFASITSLGETCLFSFGHTRYGFLKSISRLISIAIGLPAGWVLGGSLGVLWATVLAELPALFIIWPKLKQLEILKLHREIISVIIFVGAYGIGILLYNFIPVIHVR